MYLAGYNECYKSCIEGLGGGDGNDNIATAVGGGAGGTCICQSSTRPHKDNKWGLSTPALVCQGLTHLPCYPEVGVGCMPIQD